MMRRLLVGVLLLAACGGSGLASQATTTVDAGLVALGSELYQGTCAACHGADLRGTAAGPSFLSIVYEPGHHADAAFVLAVRNGVRAHHWPFGDMPPVEGLRDDDIAAITAFVRERQQIEGFEE